MTREELRDYVEEQRSLGIIPYHVYSTLIDGIDTLEQEQNVIGEWIPVSERLPEIHQVVLLSLRSLDIEVGFRAEAEPYFYCHGVDGCYVEPQNVLAWMPLPEPYKAERGEADGK